ncbi:MAG: multiheme c-type cytochrome [bacterium]
MKIKRLYLLVLITFIFWVLSPHSFCHAKEHYAKETGKACFFCHQDNNGGALKPIGIAYIRNDYSYPVPGAIINKAEKLNSSLYRLLHFVFGYLHLIVACIFVGAVFYVHIFIKPSNITGGIPKGERILGISCLTLLFFSGLYLTWYRIDSFQSFFNSSFGILLFSKLILFSIMVILAVLAITIVHKSLQKKTIPLSRPKEEDGITKENIHLYNGINGNPAYILFEGKVYDVSESQKWKGGRHFGKHSAGNDLTGNLSGAPHGKEVLERIEFISNITTINNLQPSSNTPKKIFVVMAYTNLIIIFLILSCVSSWRWGFPFTTGFVFVKNKSASDSCLSCHQDLNPGIYHDWRESIHSKVGVECYHCHKVPEDQKNITDKKHLTNSPLAVTSIVSPKTCAGCHPTEYNQYSKSKHANTHEIIWKVDKWLQYGMNNQVERTSGCYTCHGTIIKLKDGKPAEGSWPNVGVGRKNPDGSFGSCTSCHTRHKFSVAEARKPEACGQCHLGPDHPQIEIYNESKHGAIYHAENTKWNWETKDNKWLAGRDYRTPTCAACHLSEAPGISKTHDVTERLSWELQAPLTIRPNEFQAFPAHNSWEQERKKMQKVCSQCHSEGWISGHFNNLDAIVKNYNEIYYEPVAKELNSLYKAGLLNNDSYFDEELEWEFYELWHHEGRRARMGAAMMAPDYAWWHGFYEVKKRYLNFMEKSEQLKSSGKKKQYPFFPGRFEKIRY